jgi:hypothetical protein
MKRGLVVIPFCKEYEKIVNLYNRIVLTNDVTYIGIESYNFETFERYNYMLSEYKRYLALNHPYIFCNFKINNVKNRREFLDLATKANYYKLGLIIDMNDTDRIIGSSLDYDEGFDQIIIRT